MPGSDLHPDILDAMDTASRGRLVQSWQRQLGNTAVVQRVEAVAEPVDKKTLGAAVDLAVELGNAQTELTTLLLAQRDGVDNFTKDAGTYPPEKRSAWTAVAEIAGAIIIAVLTEGIGELIAGEAMEALLPEAAEAATKAPRLLDQFGRPIRAAEDVASHQISPIVREALHEALLGVTEGFVDGIRESKSSSEKAFLDRMRETQGDLLESFKSVERAAIFTAANASRDEFSAKALKKLRTLSPKAMAGASQAIKQLATAFRNRQADAPRIQYEKCLAKWPTFLAEKALKTSQPTAESAALGETAGVDLSGFPTDAPGVLYLKIYRRTTETFGVFEASLKGISPLLLAQLQEQPISKIGPVVVELIGDGIDPAGNTVYMAENEGGTVYYRLAHDEGLPSGGIPQPPGMLRFLHDQVHPGELEPSLEHCKDIAYAGARKIIEWDLGPNSLVSFGYRLTSEGGKESGAE